MIMLSLLLESPIYLLPVLASIIIAFTFHEFSHAFAAELLGDTTAKRMGRLTLNPMAHVDWFGFFLLVIAGFGWGKPVPFNANNLKNPRWGSALIGLAGPFSNLLLALLVLAVLWFLPIIGIALPTSSLLAIFLAFLFQFNLILMIFNLIPIPPLDGSKLLFAIIPDKYNDFKHRLAIQGPIILITLVIIDSVLPISIFGSLFSFVFGVINKFVG
jgi:Zn-dependent protease